ncbi:MAG: hypothetical protein SGJ09_01195 [Phycisphaerae bacterium]|nr:hypothetical protein [Phycisphaerae bacterium]
MIPAIVFSDRVWTVIDFAPVAFAAIGGIALTLGWWGTRGWEPRCRRCGHELRSAIDGATSAATPLSICTECGSDLRSRAAVRQGRRCIRLGWPGLGVAMLTLAGLTSPPAVWRARSIRSALVRQVETARLLALIRVDGSSNVVATQEFNRRLTQSDLTVAPAVVASLIDSLNSGTAPTNSQIGVMRQLTASDRLSATDLDAVASHLAQAVTSKRIPAQSALTIAMNLSMATTQARFLSRLIAFDSAVDNLVVVRLASPRVFAGDEIGLDARVGPGTLMELDDVLSLHIQGAAIRPTGSAEWQPISLDENAAFRGFQGSHTRQSVDQSALPRGSYEVRCDVSVTRAGLKGSDATNTGPLKITRIIPVEILARDTLTLEPARGPAVRGEAEVLLRELGLSLERFDGNMFASLRRSGPKFKKGGASKAATSDLRIAGEVSIGQDGQWWVIGQLVLGSHQMSMPGAGGAAPMKLDATRPIALRITPDAEKLRSQAREPSRFLDERVELRFDDPTQAPTEIIWLDALPAK